MRNGRLLSLLACEFFLLVVLVLLGDLRRHVPLFLLVFALLVACYFLAARTAMRSRISAFAMVAVAITLRIPMFFTQPSLSDDVWRHIHDGRAQHAGVNPFAYAPADPRTASYRGPEYPRINHPHLPTIYPPAAQYASRVAATFADPLLAWRILLLLAELGIIFAGAALLRRQHGNIANLTLYAWHPLAIIEATGSAHLEPLGLALLIATLLLLARGSAGAAGAALAGSVAAKLVAAPLLLFMPARRAGPAFVGALLILYLPFAARDINVLGSLGTFAQSWTSNGSIASMAIPLIGPRVYRTLALLMVVVGIALLKRMRLPLGDVALVYLLALFALSPIVHPWYLLWLLALLPLRQQPLDSVGCAALLWTITVPLAYAAHQQQLAHGVWKIPTVILLAEYLPVYALLLHAAYRKAGPMLSMMKLMPSTRKTLAKM